MLWISNVELHLLFFNTANSLKFGCWCAHWLHILGQTMYENSVVFSNNRYQLVAYSKPESDWCFWHDKWNEDSCMHDIKHLNRQLYGLNLLYFSIEFIKFCSIKVRFPLPNIWWRCNSILYDTFMCQINALLIITCEHFSNKQRLIWCWVMMKNVCKVLQ